MTRAELVGAPFFEIQIHRLLNPSHLVFFTSESHTF